MELPGSAFASRAHHGPGPGPDAGEAHCQAQAAVRLRLAHATGQPRPWKISDVISTVAGALTTAL